MLSGMPSTHSTVQDIYSRIYQSARVIFTNIIRLLYISYTSNFSGKARENAVSRISTGKFLKVWTRTPHNAILFSSSQNSLPSLSLSLAIILSFFSPPPPIFSHVHSSLTGLLVRASVFPIDEERAREAGVEGERVRERERERRERRERRWFVKFAHLFVYRHTIELKLGRVRMNAWTPAAYVRRYA